MGQKTGSAVVLNTDDYLNNLFKTVDTQIMERFSLDTAATATTTKFEFDFVDIITFIESPRYQNEANQIWPGIKRLLEEIYDGVENRNVNEVIIKGAVGSGKSQMSSLIEAYEIYRDACLLSPQAYYGLASGSTIVYLNTSVTATNARKIIFDKLVKLLEKNWFFKNTFPWDHNILSELRFLRKNLIAFPGSSAETCPLGFNIRVAIHDESAFRQITKSSTRYHQREFDAMQEIYDVAKERIDSRGRFATVGGLSVVISSPKHAEDFLDRKIEEAKTNPRIFAKVVKRLDTKPVSLYSGKWFWFDTERNKIIDNLYIREDLEKKSDEELVNIARSYGHKEEATRDEYVKWILAFQDTLEKLPIEHREAFRLNPRRAKRDVLAIAEEAQSPFAQDPLLVDVRVNFDREAPIDDSGIKIGYDIDAIVKPWFTGLPNTAYCFHGDLAMVRDCLGFAISHVAEGKVVVDLMLEIRPENFGGEIDLDFPKVLIEYLAGCRGFVFRKGSFDGWQSAYLIQLLNRQGIKTEVLSIDRNTAPYDLLEELIRGGLLDYYYYKPFIRSYKKLELVNGKVEHQPGERKDITDAVAGAVFNAVQLHKRDVTMYHPRMVATVMDKGTNISQRRRMLEAVINQRVEEQEPQGLFQRGIQMPRPAIGVKRSNLPQGHAYPANQPLHRLWGSENRFRLGR